MDSFRLMPQTWVEITPPFSRISVIQYPNTKGEIILNEIAENNSSTHKLNTKP